jgi:type I restriction enzyme S subunit
LETERQITQSGLTQISSGLLPAGTLLMSSRAPIGYLAISQVPVTVNQGMIAMLPNGKVSSTYAWLWAAHNMEAIVANANGSTFLEISKRNFRPISAVKPDEPVLSAFDRIVGPLLARIAANETESRTLAHTRDFLLPKLLSGEVRVYQSPVYLDDVESKASGPRA